MTPYFLLFAKDNRHNNWLLGYDTESGHTIFPQYRDLICPNCGKVDEDAAIARGIDASVRVRSPFDFVKSDDGFVLVSARFRDVVSESGIRGLEITPLPGDPKYFLAQPSIVRADFGRAGLEVHGPDRPPYRHPGPRKATADGRCAHCGRHFELCGLPALACMEIPADPMVVFSPQIPLEKQRGRLSWIFVSQAVRKALGAARLKGMEFFEAY